MKSCTESNPRPEEHVWFAGAYNTIARWPNQTDLTSAWVLQQMSNQTHVVSYYIPDGWGTNLVTSYQPLNMTNLQGFDLYEGEYVDQGARRVIYRQLTLETGVFTIPGVPDGREPFDKSYNDSTANDRHYWSPDRTNETADYITHYRVWGEFTTFTTHLSNHMNAYFCHLNGSCNDFTNTTNHSRGRFESTNIMQCPFQFRCFSPEASAGSPNCHKDFPFDYAHSTSGFHVHAPPNIRPCVESCPGCASCPMIQCWKDDNNKLDGDLTSNNFSALQVDTINYM